MTYLFGPRSIAPTASDNGYLSYAGVGSRKTPQAVCDSMTEISIRLQMIGWVLRSGGAEGADTAFELGAGDLKEIFIPWDGFKGRRDGILLSAANHAKAWEIAKKFHPSWERCSAPAKLLQTRNVPQVLGENLGTPAKMLICWTKDGKFSGGTGQALRIAHSYEIPIFNLRVVGDENRLREFAGI